MKKSEENEEKNMNQIFDDIHGKRMGKRRLMGRKNIHGADEKGQQVAQGQCVVSNTRCPTLHDCELE